MISYDARSNIFPINREERLVLREIIAVNFGKKHVAHSIVFSATSFLTTPFTVPSTCDIISTLRWPKRTCTLLTETAIDLGY